MNDANVGEKKICVADPGVDGFMTPGPGMGKKSRYKYGMNISDHISEIRNNFWVTNA